MRVSRVGSRNWRGGGIRRGPPSWPPWSRTSSRPIHKTRGEHQATGVPARQPAVGTRCRRSARFHGAACRTTGMAARL